MPLYLLRDIQASGIYTHCVNREKGEEFQSYSYKLSISESAMTHLLYYGRKRYSILAKNIEKSLASLSGKSTNFNFFLASPVTALITI